MLKNKFKLIAILTVLILALTLPIVRAENETANPIAAPDATASENNTNQVANPVTTSSNNATTSLEENFKRNDVYLTGDNITIDYVIDGNLFVVANNVTIDSQIGGDAFICANTVTVGEKGYVFSNLFTFSKNVIINGVVYDLYAACQDTTINGYIYRDIHVGSNTINILGTIGRNAYIEFENLNFTNEENLHGTINGNLNYTAENEVSIPEGTVTGETNFEPKQFFDGNTIQDYMMKLGTYVITVIVIWLLCLWLAPKFLKNNTSLLTTKKVLPVIGFGILTPIAIIILAVLFFVLGITFVLGVLSLFVLFLLIAISNSMFIITLNTIICNRLKIEKTIGIFGMLVASSVVLWLIGIIPFVGSLLGIVVFVLGLGIAVSSLVLKEKEKTIEE